MRKVRIGDFQMLFGEPVPDVVKAELLKRHPNYNAKLLDFLAELEGVVHTLHDMVVADVDYIVKKAAMKGINVTPFETSCNRPSCMTCLGNPEKPYHYPYFMVSLAKPIIVQAPKEAKGLQRFLGKPKRLYRKCIKQEELKDFLTGIELTREEIDAFKTARDLREQFIQFFHALILVSNFAGLSDIPLDVERKEAEEQVNV
ncbi:MAG: hypothetical protein ACPL1Z_05840 [Candidatus Bathyarchaeales archaeon]